MAPRQPIITDPSHLAEAAGTAYVCVRPSGGVEHAFAPAQRHLLGAAGDDRASWPASHMSLKGFGTPDRPVDATIEPRLVSLVEQWASETAPLELQLDGVGVFAEARIPFLRIRRTPSLGAALSDLRSRAALADLRGDEDRIAPQDWVFHLSLVYYDGERWQDVEAATRSLTVPHASCKAGDVELVGFDGGPERLLGRFPLLGRP
jgi:2'-5' RNA ligase